MSKNVCSVCGKEFEENLIVPEYKVQHPDYVAELVKSKDFICKDCIEENRALAYKDGAIAEVHGVSIEDLYKTYTRALERAEKRWKEDCIVYQDDDEFSLEVLLCVSDGEVWSYYALHWNSDMSWSESMFYATRIDLLDDDNWVEELRANCDLPFKSFEDVVKDLIEGNTFNH